MLTDQPGCPAAWGGQAELWWDLKKQEDKKDGHNAGGATQRGEGRDARAGPRSGSGGRAAKPGREGRRGGGVAQAWDRTGHGGAAGREEGAAHRHSHPGPGPRGRAGSPGREAAAGGGRARPAMTYLHPRRDRRAACAALSRPPPPGPAASPRLPAGPGGRARGRAEWG